MKTTVSTGPGLRTVFDLEGRFLISERKKPQTSRFITLKRGMELEEVNRLQHEGLDHEAQVLALPHSRYVSPFEKTWLEDWQLIPRKVRDEVDLPATVTVTSTNHSLVEG
jgi:hypothetical protein